MQPPDTPRLQVLSCASNAAISACNVGFSWGAQRGNASVEVNWGIRSGSDLQSQTLQLQVYLMCGHWSVTRQSMW